MHEFVSFKIIFRWKDFVRCIPKSNINSNHLSIFVVKRISGLFRYRMIG